MNEEEILFEEAAALAPEVRAAYLDAACAGNPEMRARLDGLLRSREASGFMKDRTAAPFTLAASSHACLPAEESGTVIGRYKLLQEIGEGGFGVVWMAEQEEPVRRRVALKIIKAGMDTREVIARFEAERQALAMMDHPNIARIFDAGETATGRPFIVMELVRGLPITRFCDEKTFTARQRLELFLDVCSAVAHAHQKGIIHRDIKPSNVMVTMDGDKPAPKVIDFGIAKATQGRLTDRTLFTRFEQFVGTPAYTSPEQTAMSGLDVDTRSDIYSLGVLLYELLTGKPPFETQSLLSAGYDEMRRIIREVEPPRPSARLATAAGEERTTLARARHVTPEKLTRLVEPDLDWIVMKAIEKNPARRYETVNGLALDVSHFLSGETVSAMPPSAAYQLRKLARRHKLALRVASAFAALLVATIAVNTWLTVRATKAETYAIEKAAAEAAARIEAEAERARAEAARVEAEAMTAFHFEIFANPQPAQGGRDLKVVDSLHHALETMKSSLADYPTRRFKLQGSIIFVLHAYGQTDFILPYAEECRDYFVMTHSPGDRDAISAQLHLGVYYMAKERWREAKDIFEVLYAIKKPLFPPEHPDAYELSNTMGNLAVCYAALELKQEALDLREERVAFCRRRGLDDSQSDMVRAKEGLASSYHTAQRWEEELQLREEVLPFRVNNTRLASQSASLIPILANLEELYERVGRAGHALRIRGEIQRIRQGHPLDPEVVAFSDSYRNIRNEIVRLLKAGQFGEAVERSRDLTGLPGGLVRVSKDVEPEAWLANSLLLRTNSDWGKANPELAAQAIEEADQLVRLLQSRNSSLAAQFARVDFFMRYGHWEQAATLGDSLYKLNPRNPWAVFRYGPLLIKTNQFDAYAKLCQEILHPFATANPDQLDVLYASLLGSYRGHAFDIMARVLCLGPPTDENLKWAALLADRAAALENDPFRNWFMLAQGLVSCREGNYAEASKIIEPLPSHLPPVGGVSAHALLAVSRHHMNETKAAQEALQNGETLFNPSWFSGTRVTLSNDPHDWLIADILLREAKSLIRPEK